MGKTPRLTVRCEYPDESSPPSEVSFRLSRSYGTQRIEILDAEHFAKHLIAPQELRAWRRALLPSLDVDLTCAKNPGELRPFQHQGVPEPCNSGGIETRVGQGFERLLVVSATPCGKVEL